MGSRDIPLIKCLAASLKFFKNIFGKRVGSEFELLFVGWLALSFHHHLLSSQPTKYADWLSTHILSSSSPLKLGSINIDQQRSDLTANSYFTCHSLSSLPSKYAEEQLAEPVCQNKIHGHPCLHRHYHTIISCRRMALILVQQKVVKALIYML